MKKGILNKLTIVDYIIIIAVICAIVLHLSILLLMIQMM